MILKNALKHLKLITKHKWVVFKLCCKVGIPWRGFVHDLSKYSFTEFGESVKYYTGTHSPISECRKQTGRSMAWVHHKAKNKHHAEYWIDFYPEPRPVMIPYKYLELNYYMKERENNLIHEGVDKLLIDVFTQVKDNGIDKTLKRKNIKELYKKYCE